MSSTEERIEALFTQAAVLEPWVGSFDRDDLLEWLRLELGDPAVLDGWVSWGKVTSRAVPLSPVLHVVSGNTPHAAFQSVLRGLLVGAHNRVKLPSTGIHAFEEWVGSLPPVLLDLLEVCKDLPDEWLTSPAAVIFGDAGTLQSFRGLLAADTQMVDHGPKIGMAVLYENNAEVAGKLAEDILRHDQRGCLSVQAVYLDAGETEIHSFGDMLAVALESYRTAHARSEVSLSDAGKVSNMREVIRFRASNEEGIRLWESRHATGWTLVYDRSPVLVPGPLNGWVSLHKLPSVLDRASLGAEASHLSTVVIHPFTPEHAMRLDRLAPPRLCPVGKAQDTTVFWHHDGMAPLASLVRWRDLG